jgi:hypothetical protein
MHCHACHGEPCARIWGLKAADLKSQVDRWGTTPRRHRSKISIKNGETGPESACCGRAYSRDEKVRYHLPRMRRWLSPH